MIINFSVAGLTFYEDWFSQYICRHKKLGFIVYRDSRVDTNTLFCIKKEKFTLVTDLQKSEDEISSQVKSKFMTAIRKVDRTENISIGYDKLTAEEYIDFYNSKFANSKGFSKISTRNLTKFSDDVFIISGYLDGELTNVQVYVFNKEKKITRALYSVSTIHLIDDKKRRNIVGSINKALHFKAMLYFKSKGFEIFDWGGYGNDENNKALAGIDRFKKSFGGEVVKLYDYYSLPFYMLTEIRRIIGK